MNLAFADRDFYYGDPYFPPEEPIEGLLSKDYAAERRKLIQWDKNDAHAKPGDPYPYQGGTNPYLEYLESWSSKQPSTEEDEELFEQGFYAGTTSIQAADKAGWVVSVTPSGGWNPATIAGRTGIGMSQRMQSFVLDARINPYNVLAPGKRPRATLTPSLALKDGRPFLSFAVQGGDSQDQNLLQFFLNVVEFGMKRAGSGGSGQLQQLSDAELVRRARIATWALALERVRPAVGPRRARRDGLRSRISRPDLWPHQRDLFRLEARLDVGRREQPRRGLRYRVVAGKRSFTVSRSQPSCSLPSLPSSERECIIGCVV